MAERALSLIKAEYELPATTVDDKSIYERIINTAAKDNVIEQKGDLELGKKLAIRQFEESYLTPYAAHAATETHSALADVKNDSATVWIGTQRPFGADSEIARAIGLTSDKVRVITPDVGGGFGGKSQVGQAVQAARLSKMTGVPIQVVWTREEEFFYDTFQPAAVVKINSGLDASNRITFWDYQVFFAGERSSQNIYNVANLRTTSRGPDLAEAGRIDSRPAPGAAPGAIQTFFLANRISIQWPQRSGSTRWNSGSITLRTPGWFGSCALRPKNLTGKHQRLPVDRDVAWFAWTTWGPMWLRWPGFTSTRAAARSESSALF